MDIMKTEPLAIEKVFNAPASRVWKAITNKDEMKRWYFDINEFKPEVGFEFQFNGGSDEKKYLHLCKILEVIPGKKIAYSWIYKDYPGESVVTFELFSEGDNTRVKLTHEGLGSFPQDSPDFARESFTAGWNEIIGTSLKNYVEKDQTAKV